MSTPNWVVKDVVPLPDYKLEVRFADGSLKLFDASYLLDYAVFAPLKNVSFFKQAHVECGTVVWNDKLDIAPERLYSDGVMLS